MDLEREFPKGRWHPSLTRLWIRVSSLHMVSPRFDKWHLRTCWGKFRGLLGVLLQNRRSLNSHVMYFVDTVCVRRIGGEDGSSIDCIRPSIRLHTRGIKFHNKISLLHSLFLPFHCPYSGEQCTADPPWAHLALCPKQA
jgi:hypothetical protein